MEISVARSNVLGILQEYENDKFTFNFKVLETENNFHAMKRIVLRTLYAFCNPLGFIQPIVMTMKIFLKKLCIEKLEWDVELSDSKTTEQQKLVKVLKTEKVVKLGPKYSTMAVDDEIFGTE